MTTQIKLARWELTEIINAIRIASEDGAYDDDPVLFRTVEALKRKLETARERCDFPAT